MFATNLLLQGSVADGVDEEPKRLDFGPDYLVFVSALFPPSPKFWFLVSFSPLSLSINVKDRLSIFAFSDMRVSLFLVSISSSPLCSCKEVVHWHTAAVRRSTKSTCLRFVRSSEIVFFFLGIYCRCCQSLCLSNSFKVNRMKEAWHFYEYYQLFFFFLRLWSTQLTVLFSHYFPLTLEPSEAESIFICLCIYAHK